MTAPTYRAVLAENLPPVLWMSWGFGLGVTPNEKGMFYGFAFAAVLTVVVGLVVASLSVVEWAVRVAWWEWWTPPPTRSCDRCGARCTGGLCPPCDAIVTERVEGRRR